jgi:hypothetical protein
MSEFLSTQSQGMKTNLKIETAAYVEEMTRELAQLTNSAGLAELTNLLILASLEAHVCNGKIIRWWEVC